MTTFLREQMQSLLHEYEQHDAEQVMSLHWFAANQQTSIIEEVERDITYAHLNPVCHPLHVLSNNTVY